MSAPVALALALVAILVTLAVLARRHQEPTLDWALYEDDDGITFA